jgi:uncharacterized membrane protein YukC
MARIEEKSTKVKNVASKVLLWVAVGFLTAVLIASIVIFILWIILVSYALFILLIKHQTIIDSTMALASITLLMEARGLYSAIINTIAKKRDWRLIRNSLFIEK